MEKKYVISITGCTHGEFSAKNAKEAVDKFLRQMMFTAMDEDSKEFYDFTISNETKIELKEE